MSRFPSSKRKNNYTFAAVIILIALVFSFFAPGGLFGLRSLVATAAFPFQVAASSAWKGVVNLPGSLINLKNLASENTELKESLEKAQLQIETMAELKNENERLRGALGFRSANRYGLRLASAQVLGKAGTILQIDRGAAAGIRSGAAVIVKDGLVGQVIEVSPLAAKVLLVNDRLSSVAGVDQRSRAFGAVEGYSTSTLGMKYVSANSDVQAGDRIVSSSISSLFPPGIPVGEVTSANRKDTDLFYEIRLKPAVDFSSLEEVFVVL